MSIRHRLNKARFLNKLYILSRICCLYCLPDEQSSQENKWERKVTDTASIKDTSDLIHMNHAESTNPGRPLTHNK